MNDKDKEAFDKWYASQDKAGVFGNDDTSYVDLAWLAACEYKQKEIHLIQIKLWQAIVARGYPIPGYIPEGDYKCGLCESRAKEIYRKDAQYEALLEVIRILSSNRGA